MKSNINIARFIRVLDDLDRKGERKPGLILSHAGFGKTSTIAAYCKYMDYNLLTIIPSQSAADDILGIECMDPDTKEMRRLTPSWYNRLVTMMKNGKRTILFIDEISTCDSFIQAPLLNLIFNRDLGGHVLPDNCFIVAAGNYSSDLDGAFKMNAPLVNRFLLLNLWKEDFDIMELVTNEFDKLKTKEDYEKYFKIEPEAPLYNFPAFLKWVEEEREIDYSKDPTSTETEEIGLLGFTSVRSVSYSFRFIQQYMATYADNLWMRVAGDTLGFSHKREGKPMRLVFENNADKFTAEIKPEMRGLSEICKEILSKGLTDDRIKELGEAVNSAEIKAFSNQDLKQFSKVVESHKDNKNIVYLNDVLTKKIVSTL